MKLPQHSPAEQTEEHNPSDIFPGLADLYTKPNGLPADGGLLTLLTRASTMLNAREALSEFKCDGTDDSRARRARLAEEAWESAEAMRAAFRTVGAQGNWAVCESVFGRVLMFIDLIEIKS